jgi:hypothetical protein
MHVELGWPEQFIHTVYDRMYGDLSAQRIIYKHRIYEYTYGSGQP